MATTTLELPMMFGDHHVIEVRRLLSSMSGVDDVYASSCFQVVEIVFDESKVTLEQITEQLDKAGYTGEQSFPVEKGSGSSAPNGQEAFFRHTAVIEQVKESISFAQKAPYAGRPLWPCPGVGVVQDDE